MLKKTELDLNTNSISDAIDIREYFHAYKEQLLEAKTNDDLVNLIKTEFIKICQQYISKASASSTIQAEIIDKEENRIYLLQYVLTEAIKDLMILHRDVMLQLQIGKHKNIERLATNEALIALFKDSKKVLVESIDFFIKKLGSEENRIKGLSIKKDGIHFKMKHHASPWEIYEEQFQTLLSQFDIISQSGKIIERSIAVFREIKAYTILVMDKTIKDSVGLSKIIADATVKINEEEEKSDILSWLDTVILPSIDNDPKTQEEYTSSIETKIKSLANINLPVATDDGLLLEKKIDFNKSTKKWMDYNLLPLLMDFWEIKNNVNSYLKHTLLNLRTSLNLSRSNDALITAETQVNILDTIQKTLAQNLEKQSSIVAEINELLDVYFLVSNIYGSKEFLEVSLQTSFTQYTSETNTILVNLQKTLKKLTSKFSTTYDKAVSDAPYSKMEDATKCIAQRMFKEDNAHYDMLFLNKNFIGDHFLIPRASQEQKFEDTISQWDDGFNNSILVLGKPLCGKSTFLAHSAKKYFSRKTIELKPDSNFTVEGRKFKTTKNLQEALKEIKKITSSAKPLLILDDLELWRDEDQSLLNNVRTLIDFIESESNILVMAATNQPLCDHLDMRMGFSKTFSTVLNLDRCDTDEIYRAVLLRNGATHKSLVNKDREPLSSKTIENFVVKLCKTFNNNIGEVLQAWTYGTTVIKDDEVLYEEKIGRFPDFFSREEIIILKYISLYGYLNERILKDFTGSQYGSKFKSSLKRLINTKVLLRDDTGYLKINPVVNHDIYEILKYRDIIK